MREIFINTGTLIILIATSVALTVTIMGLIRILVNSFFKSRTMEDSVFMFVFGLIMLFIISLIISCLYFPVFSTVIAIVLLILNGVFALNHIIETI